MTPGLLVELECPACKATHWTIDSENRGMMLSGLPELGWGEREYKCPVCSRHGTGFMVRRKSPSAFFLQPHQMYPMSQEEFNEWQVILEAQFPDHACLRDPKWAATGGPASRDRASSRYSEWSQSEAGRYKFTCPCCGYIAFREPPGSYANCGICNWTDDSLALEHATTMADGGNSVTLEEAQRRFQSSLPSWPRRLLGLGRPRYQAQRDPKWRPLNPAKDKFAVWPGHDARLEPVRDSRLYYWRAEARFMRDLTHDARPGYFDDARDDFDFGRFLHLMGEPRLGGPERYGDEFRVLLLRSFGRPVAVRIVRNAIHVKVLSGGPLGGNLILNNEREISQREFAEFWDRLRKADFWKTPLRVEHQGLDGSFWILEGSGPTGHRMVLRWSPKRSAFREACEYLLQLARLGEELDDVLTERSR